jgi:hypothetical protein
MPDNPLKHSYCSYSFGTAALRPNICDSLPPCHPAGAINFIWTTYLGNYHNCSTLVFLVSGPEVGNINFFLISYHINIMAQKMIYYQVYIIIF